MSEHRALRPGNLAKAATIDHARELLDVVLTSNDGDEIGDAIEAAASDADLAQALLFNLVCRVRGWPENRTGVEFVAENQPDHRDLWKPS